MKKMLTILFIFLLSSIVYAELSEDNAQLYFIKAGAQYQSGDYQKAIDNYLAILNQGVESSAIYYNLANSYFKSENLGKAILYYEKAFRLSPRDPDIEANLRFARSLVERYGDVVDKPWWEKLTPHFHIVSLDEVTYICLFLFFLLGGIVFLGIVRHWRLSRQLMWSGIVLVLLIFHSIILIVKVGYNSHQGVVLYDIKAKFEPMNDATDHFQLGEGMVIEKISEQYGWIKIKRFDGRIGWVPKETIDQI